MTSEPLWIPHKPDPTETYNLWTAELEQIASALSKSAVLLLNRLLRNAIAGIPQMVRLKELANLGCNRQGRFNGKPFTLKTMRAAMEELQNLELIKVVEDFGRGIVQVIARHPGHTKPIDSLRKKSSHLRTKLPSREQNFPTGNKTSISTAETLSEQPIEIPTDLSEKSDTTTHPNHPVDDGVTNQSDVEQREVLPKRGTSETEGNPENFDEKPANSGGNSAPGVDEIFNELEAMGIYLNPKLEQFIRETEAVIVRNAIASVKEYRTKTPVRNPAGLLITAIKEQWKPEQTKSKAPAGFVQWYEQARQRHLVQCSMSQDGEQLILLSNDTWHPWEYLQGLSWDEIKQLTEDEP